MSKFKKLHIVIAEDDPDDAMIIEGSFINNDDFESVTLVNNGQELIDYLKSARIPDVLLTDINMPIMDGIEALETIYNSENLKTIPCFVYSTSINPSYEIKCKSLGVIGYLVKPNNIEDFDEIPKEILALLKREI
jgi:CheY-like chemotaxis protein